MKMLVAATIFVEIISPKFGVSYEQLVVIVLIVAFGVLVSIYRHIDLECLYKIGIQYAYDEWGYYLTCKSSNKFVGDSQIMIISKFHKYVHSFLDIVALCRAVAFSDKMSGENRICIITGNLGELFTNYTDYAQEKTGLWLYRSGLQLYLNFMLQEKSRPR